MTNDPILDVERLDRVMALAEAAHQRGELDMGSWRRQRDCKTTLCIAGITAEDAGGMWTFPAWEKGSMYLDAEPDDDPADILTAARKGDLDGLRVITVSRRARRLLGLTEEEEYGLFHGPPTDLDAIHGVVDQIKAGYFRDPARAYPPLDLDHMRG